ncbi:ADP-ribosylglycohydrolase family protein [Roseiflexus castenholzii]|uniref:ADP-ribosylation/Crystallin J1 n=1 Tax=Roseiflexus castenholzii (strain DSM 13941 / HLO8) TaxID=383372 RepID=A7NPB8_ROSCS|nr:ADP-ribosylglycohydrolase family protein [Roseiflexus castenholzii]ABU59414.1 ADP-ribosylation/Crystallin J1 [Roseiflexus castenholzii DSM 13941]
MPLPADYVERVYAGVLGKIIGVYLGRPFEGWTYDRIMAELGEVWYYVHEQCGVPLVVTDDDLSGTFTFLRALPDYGNTRELSPTQIGETWLNYIIENRAILWWGGMGRSTEHTAFLRLKHGIAAPHSGSAALNGRVIAEQIGAQIFIDGWAMVAPGDPELAADLARRAASVSHDGEAIYGAQVIAAMESLAFVERDLHVLIDTAVRFIPHDSIIFRLIANLREWRARFPDWRVAREQIAAQYGYDRYPGNCHIVPNHALIMLGLLYGEDDFQKSLMITATAGWDTDCNAGNVGCLLGIKNGLAGIDAGPDWRGPIADRLYLPTADGGRAVTDAVRETFAVVNIGRDLAGETPLAPKHGARFHFALPGSVQGFIVDDSADSRETLSLENVTGQSVCGDRCLALRYRHLALGRAARAATATFLLPETLRMPGYAMLASPTLYPGQNLSARVCADRSNPTPVQCRLYLLVYDSCDAIVRKYGDATTLAPGSEHVFAWRVPDTGGQPIAAVGVELRGRGHGTVYLDYLTWEGTPEATFGRPAGGSMWRRAWVNGVSAYEQGANEPYRLIQNEGTGLLIQGTREWRDYRVCAVVTPHLAEAFGLGARVQGMRRYYALLLTRTAQRNSVVQLVRVCHSATLLAEASFAWAYEQPYIFDLCVVGRDLIGVVYAPDGASATIAAQDDLLDGGGIALVLTEGHLSADQVTVRVG